MLGRVTKTGCLLFFWLVSGVANAQSKHDAVPSSLGFQWGFSLKATLEFALSKNTQRPVFRVCGDFGVASEFLANAFYPSINTEVQLYNGGFGSWRRSAYNKPV